MAFRAILPCAGFGTRMSMLPHESKEMLPDPDVFNPGGAHIIDYSIRFCVEHQLLPHVISRPEKVGLNEYVKYHIPSATFQEIKVDGEWPSTILKSKAFWEDDNLLVLPDTRFTMTHQGMNHMKHCMNMGCQAVIFTHEVPDPDKWGIIHDYTIFEKPGYMTGTQTAWGMIAFKKDYGEQMFTAMAEKEPFTLIDTAFIKLNSFVDITRKK